MRILLAEDDQMVAAALSSALASAGYRVDHAPDGEMALAALEGRCHDLLLLDLGLPKLTGTEVLAEARSRGLSVPVLIVSARDDTQCRVEGLDLGADDFLVKPFDVQELQARIRAVLRRHAGHAQSLLRAGEVTLDLASHEVSYRGTSLVLPSREFALLQVLAQRPGMIFARADLEARLYGWGQEVESNAIEVLIHYIRRKFDKQIIRNVRGAGWLIPKAG